MSVFGSVNKQRPIKCRVLPQTLRHEHLLFFMFAKINSQACVLLQGQSRFEEKNPQRQGKDCIIHVITSAWQVINVLRTAF